MPIEKRQRSPSVPFIGLVAATVRAFELYKRVGRTPLVPSEAAEIWGLAAKTGSAFRRIAALRGYGLVERAEDAHRIRISDLAATVFEGHEPEVYQRAYAAAALSPEIVAHNAAKWSAGRPADAICIADFADEPSIYRGGVRPKAFCRYLMRRCGLLAAVRPGLSSPFRRRPRPPPVSGSAILFDCRPIRAINPRLGTGRVARRWRTVCLCEENPGPIPRPGDHEDRGVVQPICARPDKPTGS